MATTTPDSIRTPNPSDPYNLISDLGILANDTQAALVKRANSYVGTSTQRVAFTTAPEGVHWQDTNGSKQIWARRAGAWVDISPSTVASASGAGSAAVALTATNINVTFPAGTFSSTPGVMVMGNSPSSAGSRVYHRVTSISATGFTIEATFTAGPAGTWAYRWLAVG